MISICISVYLKAYQIGMILIKIKKYNAPK